jgi:hypothetical protein
MNPIQNPQFDHDYVKFVYQQPDVRMVQPQAPPAKPFVIKPAEKSGKSKKENKKKEGRRSEE